MVNHLASLHPTDVGLILSYKCQSRCAHCIYNCSPNWKEWIQTEDIHKALEAMLLWPQAFQVHFTGGEPFLNFHVLLQAVEIATELGIPRYVETNAGWAVTEKLVDKRLTALYQAGLQAILISVSPFHAETIPPDRTLRTIQKSIEIFGPENTLVYQSHWFEQLKAFHTNQPTPLEKYIETFGQAETGRLFWKGYGLISGGRAGYQLGHLAPQQPAEYFNGEDCAYEILYSQHSHFDLYGNFIPGFCGGLSLGSWYDLPVLLARYQRKDFPTIFSILIEYGPYGLFEAAVLEYNYKPLPNGYAGKCHLCADVRRHLSTNGSFPELQPAQYYAEI